jgi:hypothetical protein
MAAPGNTLADTSPCASPNWRCTTLASRLRRSVRRAAGRDHRATAPPRGPASPPARGHRPPHHRRRSATPPVPWSVPPLPLKAAERPNSVITTTVVRPHGAAERFPQRRQTLHPGRPAGDPGGPPAGYGCPIHRSPAMPHAGPRHAARKAAGLARQRDHAVVAATATRPCPAAPVIARRPGAIPHRPGRARPPAPSGHPGCPRTARVSRCWRFLHHAAPAAWRWSAPHRR